MQKRSSRRCKLCPQCHHLVNSTKWHPTGATTQPTWQNKCLIFDSGQFTLEFCNSLYYKLPKSQLSRLQQIQNYLACTFIKAPTFCHITPILCSLHWLRITERIEYKLLPLTYKVLNYPTSIPSQPISVQRPYSTRSSSTVTLARPPSSSSLKNNWSLLWLCLSLESIPFICSSNSFQYQFLHFRLPIPSAITFSSDSPLCSSITIITTTSHSQKKQHWWCNT